MATLKFLFRSKRPSSFLTVRLQFRIKNDGANKDIALDAKSGFHISKEDWNLYAAHKNKKTKSLNIINIKQRINNELANLSRQILTELEQEDSVRIDKEWLQRRIDFFYNIGAKIQIKKEIPTKLVPFISVFNDPTISENTLKNRNVLANKLLKFENYRGKEIEISEIGYDFNEELLEFLDYKGYAPTTIESDYRIIRTFCSYANKKGALLSETFEEFKYKIGERDYIHPILNFEELKTIKDLIDLPDYLDNARDWLLVSCYTGQRISDFLRFNPEMIREEKGKKLIEFKQTKTKKLMAVPILSVVQEILDKRGGNFPRKISEQNYNDYIKIVCEKANINEEMFGYRRMKIKNETRRVAGNYSKFELISSHVGRRTMATNFYGKLPTSDLMYLSGHSKEANFLIYINKKNSERAHDIFERAELVINNL